VSVSKPAWIRAVTPPHNTACSPNKSVSHSSLNVVSIIHDFPHPIQDAYERAISKAFHVLF
jgi:hypothetical protein